MAPSSVKGSSEVKDDPGTKAPRLMMLLDPGNRRELHFYLLLPMSRALLYRILQCEAVAARICSLLQQGLTVARLIPRSMGKKLSSVEKCGVAQISSACLVAFLYRPRLRFFPFLLLLVLGLWSQSSLIPDYSDWSFEAWWEDKEKTAFFSSSPLLTACLGGGVSQGDGG